MVANKLTKDNPIVLYGFILLQRICQDQTSFYYLHIFGLLHVAEQKTYLITGGRGKGYQNYDAIFGNFTRFRLLAVPLKEFWSNVLLGEVRSGRVGKIRRRRLLRSKCMEIGGEGTARQGTLAAPPLFQ